MTENGIGTLVIAAAITVHRGLGPGLLESVYEIILARELNDRGLKVILELKSFEQVTRAHRKQLQTYLRLTGCKLGYVLNFAEEVMKTGITRRVNGLEE